MARLTKQFIVRKYVMASSAIEAIKKEATCAVSDVWVVEEWSKNNPELAAKDVGFNVKKS